MNIIKTIIRRWKAETPKFFIGVKRLAISLGSSATAVWLINDSMSLALHPTILVVCKYLIAISAAMGVTAQLTQVDPSQQEKTSGL